MQGALTAANTDPGSLTTTVCTGVAAGSPASCNGTASVASDVAATKVANLQTRVNQLEADLRAYGLLP